MTPLDIARSHLGLREVRGAAANPAIAAMFADVGHPEVTSDEISWCAAFLGSCLKRAGLPHTGSLAARSYLKWGVPVALQDARPGDVAVIWRGKPDGWQGHVFFLEQVTATTLIGIGGNQSNAVTRASHPIDRLLGIRRAAAAIAPPARPAPSQAEIAAAIKPLTDHGSSPWFDVILTVLSPFRKLFGGRK